MVDISVEVDKVVVVGTVLKAVLVEREARVAVGPVEVAKAVLNVAC